MDSNSDCSGKIRKKKQIKKIFKSEEKKSIGNTRVIIARERKNATIIWDLIANENIYRIWKSL